MKNNNIEKIIELINTITNDSNYIITTNDLKKIKQVIKELKKNKVTKNNIELLNYINNFYKTLKIANKAKYYLEKKCNNFYINYIRNITYKEFLTKEEQKKIYMINIISEGNKKEIKTKLTHEDIINFITDKHNISNYHEMQPLFEHNKSKANIGSCKNHVKTELENYIIYNLNNNNKAITIDEFINYYNSNFEKNFQEYGYNKDVKLNRRILIEILYKNKYNNLCFSSTGFEEELKNNDILKEKIDYENNEINDFIIEKNKKNKLYNQLLKKYKKETNLLLNQNNISIEYFIYKYINKEDRENYLDMVKNYLFLLSNLKNQYNKKGIHKETAKIIETELENRMLCNPKDMEIIINNYLNLLKNERKFFGGVSNFINSQKLYKNTKEKHIKYKSLDFIQLNAKLYNKGNIFEIINNNKELNSKYYNEYFNYFEKMFPELKNESKILKKKYIIDEKKYTEKESLKEIDELKDQIINEALKFVFNDNNINNFYTFLRKNSSLNKYSKELIDKKLKEIDINLYHSVKTKEIKRYNIILDYLENNYSSFEYYLESNNITNRKLTELLNEVKTHNKLLYIKFIDKYKKQEETNYKYYIEEVSNICNKIINGLKTEKNTRKYNYLDYNLDTNLSLKEFEYIFKNKLNLNHEDIIKIYKFISTIIPNTFKTKLEPKELTENTIKNYYYGIKDRKLTDREKEAVIKYMDDHNFNRYEPLFIQIIKSYFNDEIDLKPYMNNNTKKLKKEINIIKEQDENE